MSRIVLNINGKMSEADAAPHDSLLRVLRNRLGLIDVRRGCDYGGCGSCTVVMDGKAVYSCMMPAHRAAGKRITTIEGLMKNGKLDPIQEAFIKTGAIQCGYCTNGMILSAKALLDANHNPSEDEIREALVGNLCRCTGYVKIIQAIRMAASEYKGSGR